MAEASVPVWQGKMSRHWDDRRKVYLAARDAGCWFIKFDQDGDEYKQFEQYEW